MADYISQVKLPNNTTYDFRDKNLKLYTGSCSTAAGTAIKDVTTDGAFTLAKGAIVFVNFTNTNSAAVGDLKLRVNSSVSGDAKPIKYLVNGNDPMNIPSVGYLRANQTYMFRYDGTNWVADLNYYSYSNTATAADNILDGSNSGTQITYAPYTAQQDKLSFDTSTTDPSRTDRLNLNGYLYATKFVGILQGNADSATSISATGGSTAKFWRGDNTWSNELASSVGASTAILKLSTSSTISSSYVWGTTVTVPNLGSGANVIGIMAGQAMNAGNAGYLNFHYAGSNSNNNYVSLGIHSNDNLLRVYKTGNVSIGADNNSYKLYVNGTSYINGTTTIFGPLRVGKSDTAGTEEGQNGYAVNNSGSNNYIAFYGVNGDGPGGYNHTYIGESIYGPKDTVNEKSELLLFHGNDLPGSGPDRIRLFANEVDIQVYTSALSGQWNTIRATTGTQVANFKNGQVTITGNILPEANSTRTLGASGTAWDSLYINKIYGSSGTPKIRLCPSPVNTNTVKVGSTDKLTTSDSDEEWLKALLRELCIAYPNEVGTFKGGLTPNSNGYYEVYIYNTSAVDTNTKLPQYSYGTFRKHTTGFYIFGTNSYTPFCYPIAKGDAGAYNLKIHWDNVYSKPTTFSPSSHTHPATDITGTLGIDHGGTGATTASAAWTALGGGASGKHADSYFALASHTHNYLVPLASISSGQASPNNTFALAIKRYFDDNKATIPRDKFISFQVSAYSNAVYAFGHFINGYDDTPYGGFYAVHYDTPRFLGISNGSYEESKIARINVTNTITSGQIMIADGDSGKIKTSGYTIAKSVPSNAVFTDTNKYHKNGSWGGTNNLTYTATAVNSADELAFTLSTASTSVYGATKLYDGVDSTSTTLAATANAVKTAYDKAAGIVAAADAMVFKGTRDGAATSSNGGAGGLTPAANRGDTYKVATAGYINGEPVEVGDIIICTTDSTAASTSSNYSTIKANWVIIQNNVDGAVFYGSNSLSNGQYLVADGANGKVKSQALPTASTTTAGITTVGASGGAAAYSHGTHVSYGTSTAKIGTAAAGTASTVSRSDHVHAIDLATGDNNGQVKIAGTNVTVKGLGDRAFDSTSYLPLNGGNMTGNINRYYSASSTEPMLKLSANNVNAYLFQIGHGTSAGNVASNYYILRYMGNQSSPDNELQLVSAVSTSTEKIAIKINENGVISFPQMTKGSATKPVYFNAGVFTEGTTYAGGTAVTLNGTGKGGSTASFYAPTAAGTDGYVLKSQGSGAPEWEEEYKIEIIRLA